ncbi:MAG: glycosyltransferase family 4 protein [Tolypothrix carrinoi HA7290-LM1]|jgi:glycosyltransferase involved in cell wall biosynthesis|nr:glycosyltransferase family 4 protein [Tolypothrix carrinoi HA7290-LM1]
MKIAFISYEYPPDTALGGIATYVYQVSQLLTKRGHHVEVFTGSLHRCGTEIENGVLVYRVLEKNRQNFPKHISKVFAERHSEIQFDVIEGPDIFAEAQEAVQLCPDIPLVLKLHIPSFLIEKINSTETPFITRIRKYLGLIRRGINPVQHLKYKPQDDIECHHALDADEVVILTKDMADKVISIWGLDIEKVSQIPNPYIPSEKLLNIPVDTQTGVVTFIGRLETRKGVIDLAKAIPLVMQRCPKAKFRFVGRSHQRSPKSGMDMRLYLERMLGHYKQFVEFTDFVAPDDIPSVLGDTDICVFPSIWENFPNVCLEAMAAGRGVVGSSAGGMVEMLDYGKAGRLVPPRCPRKIANAVIELLENPSLRMHLGQAARERLLIEYSADRIGALLEASYARAIENRQANGYRYQKLTPSLIKG